MNHGKMVGKRGRVSRPPRRAATRLWKQAAAECLCCRHCWRGLEAETALMSVLPLLTWVPLAVSDHVIGPVMFMQEVSSHHPQRRPQSVSALKAAKEIVLIPSEQEDAGDEAWEWNTPAGFSFPDEINPGDNSHGSIYMSSKSHEGIMCPVYRLHSRCEQHALWRSMNLLPAERISLIQWE